MGNAIFKQERNLTLEAIAARVRIALDYLNMGKYDIAKQYVQDLDAILPEPTMHNMDAARHERG